MPDGPWQESVHGAGTQQVQGESAESSVKAEYLRCMIGLKMCEESVTICLSPWMLNEANFCQAP